MTACDHPQTTTVSVCSPRGEREIETCDDCSEIVREGDDE